MSIKRYSVILGILSAVLLAMGPIGIILGFSTLVLVILAVLAGIVSGVVTR